MFIKPFKQKRQATQAQNRATVHSLSEIIVENYRTSQTAYLEVLDDYQSLDLASLASYGSSGEILLDNLRLVQNRLTFSWRVIDEVAAKYLDGGRASLKEIRSDYHVVTAQLETLVYDKSQLEVFIEDYRRLTGEDNLEI